MKTYLIGFNSKNVNPCGSDCTIITRYKSIRKLKELANYMLLNSINKVTKVISLNEITYTQKVCEMDNVDFYEYCLVYGNIIAVKELK